MKSFDILDETKKKRILDAAINEFAENSYEQASTNRIVKSAQIGKGMLFHYFKTKQSLYEYLISHAIQIMEEFSVLYIDDSEPDFIERMKGSAKLKIGIYEQHPDLFHFIGQVMLEKESKVPATLAHRLHQMQLEGMARMFNGIDTEKFREDVDSDEILKLIGWSIEGYSQELLAKLDGQNFAELELEPYWKEFYAFLEMLKRIYYKQEV
ncbi:TetR/AcrR family transcriptional regulator [Sporosarcina aquimarina]|uniref:TetR/AcrR family transcriptional regulator n=1 Tax=Sporosarcina aquimarina TaxID=114975 RepID=A0ABU4FVK7_9BACL|nr:TetR/AcrR family transcriptional regulator [Sporosarcina aquimarina]MDW0108755.1 TetR/AcrR family transcriptional regulator [Sporosarcina aquimarina]